MSTETSWQGSDEAANSTLMRRGRGLSVKTKNQGRSRTAEWRPGSDDSFQTILTREGDANATSQN
eukprot:3837963-Pleurochrysis_carterae.AAC.2